MEQLRAVKLALHVVYREVEQNRILNFCKSSVYQEKPMSLYACGCLGTGKSLSMEKECIRPPDLSFYRVLDKIINKRNLIALYHLYKFFTIYILRSSHLCTKMKDQLCFMTFSC